VRGCRGPSVATAVAMVLGACGSTPPTPAPSAHAETSTIATGSRSTAPSPATVKVAESDAVPATASATDSVSVSASVSASASVSVSVSDSASVSVSGSDSDSTDPADWLNALEDAVIADLAAGQPLVAQVHVPLCDNGTLACGNARLGDGDNPDSNLYWATSPGFGRYFDKRSRGWTLVLDGDGGAIAEPDVLDLRVYRRTITSSQAWRERGAPTTFPLYIVALAWRGAAIDAALATYATHLSGGPAVPIELPDGTTLAAGGAARLVAYVGHNRLMDVGHPYAWPAAGTARRGMIAIACHTAAYMQPLVPAPTRVPLLLVRDFLFSNAAPLEGAVLAFARGEGFAGIRRDAAAGYAAVQQREVRRVAGAFTNPASAHWHNGGR
jgi:hypothetical protein